MPIQSLKSGVLSRSTAVGNAIILPGDFESIATAIVSGASTSSIIFSSIPQTFTHLQLRMFAKTNFTTYPNDNFSLRFNSDTGSNYNMHNIYSTGSVMGSQGAGTQNFMYISYVIGNSSTTNMFSSIVLDILDYTSTNKAKTVRYRAGCDTNTASGKTVSFGSGLWFATPSAINTITLTPSDGTSILQNSHFALYGIRG